MEKKYLSQKYYPEIDIIRGLAVLAMVIFHIAFQLRFIFNQNIPINNWFWIGLPFTISGTFLTIAGISLYISVQNKRYQGVSQILKRSGLIFGLGMCLTLITSIAHTYIGGYVYFGILHCISLASLISYYTIPWNKYINLLGGLMIIGIGLYGNFTSLGCKCTPLFWLHGYFSNGLSNQIDYYPLIPSIGFVWIGIFIGKILYPHSQRNFNLNLSSSFLSFISPIIFLGRHSLLIYCIHTPIILSIIYLLLCLKR